MSKKSLFSSILFILLSSICAQAQLNIDHSGKVYVGEGRLNHDLDSVLTMTLFGPNGDYRAGAKLAFGDFGRRESNGWNVFVGEYGNTDSDRLWLHGKRGFAISYNNASRFALFFSPTFPFRLTVKAGVQADNLYVSCDDALKTNISAIQSPIDRLLALRCQQYDYTFPAEFDLLPGEVLENVQRNNEEQTEGNTQGVRSGGSRKMGFSSSDLALVFPELLTTDTNGYQYVNIVELLPLAVAVIQEQQNIIDRLNVRLGVLTDETERLQSELTVARTVLDSLTGIDISLRQTAPRGTGTTMADSAYLLQNQPNPFSTTTTIQYYVPDGVHSAAIYIYDLMGTRWNTLPIGSTGHGSVALSGSTLPAGTYVYTLVVDGVIADSKRMTLTQ